MAKLGSHCFSCLRRTKRLFEDSPLSSAGAGLAGTAKSVATNVGELLATKTGPRLGAAWEWASPRVEAAWRKGITAAAPKVEEAARALAPRVDDARDAIVERALPAIVAAVDSAARAAAGAAAEPVKKAKKGRAGKIIIWSLAGAAATGVGYWLWRQTRPVTDPWAEEDWDDFDSAPEEDFADAAGDAAEAVGEAAGHAVKAVTDAAKKATGAVKKASGAVKKAAADAVHPDPSADPDPEES
ncbi:MAG: hypothetical protein LBJ02_08455 [Bifidobacteriaceae bacterium]|jgi:uncharacterized protein YjbJ (UPF0337 family)|nr:hypothetical protein [Bifidobacteriaceae bacterium]